MDGINSFRPSLTTPEIGKPWADAPELRKLIIAFGDASYIALDRYEPDEDAVYLLALRHQTEVDHRAKRGGLAP